MTRQRQHYHKCYTCVFHNQGRDERVTGRPSAALRALIRQPLESKTDDAKVPEAV